jgi:hypothetical protein
MKDPVHRLDNTDLKHILAYALILPYICASILSRTTLPPVLVSWNG